MGKDLSSLGRARNAQSSGPVCLKWKKVISQKKPEGKKGKIRTPVGELVVKIRRDTSQHTVTRHLPAGVREAYDEACAEADELSCIVTYGVPLSEKDSAIALATSVEHAANQAAVIGCSTRDRVLAQTLKNREKETLRLSTVNRILSGLPQSDFSTRAFNRSLLNECIREKLACPRTNIGARSELRVCCTILQTLVDNGTCNITIRRNVKYRVTNVDKGKCTAGEIDIVLLKRNSEGIWQINRLFEVKGARSWSSKNDADLQKKVAEIKSQVARQMAYGSVSVIMAGDDVLAARNKVQNDIYDVVNVLTDEEVWCYVMMVVKEFVV